VIAWQYPAALTGYGFAPAIPADVTDYGELAAKTLADAIGQAVSQDSTVKVRPVVAEGHPG
jgi:hypothetical protein